MYRIHKYVYITKFKAMSIYFTGIRIKKYSYSEAQAGKSYCDSKIEHMRTKMRSYVANGSNILSAADMKAVIDHGAGTMLVYHFILCTIMNV